LRTLEIWRSIRELLKPIVKSLQLLELRIYGCRIFGMFIPKDLQLYLLDQSGISMKAHLALDTSME
jgi:hypothetical protein